jgi:hypothetical protein
MKFASSWTWPGHRYFDAVSLNMSGLGAISEALGGPNKPSGGKREQRHHAFIPANFSVSGVDRSGVRCPAGFSIRVCKTVDSSEHALHAQAGSRRLEQASIVIQTPIVG